MTASPRVTPLYLCVCVIAALALAACTTTGGARLAAVPASMTDNAGITGVPADEPIRYWGDVKPDIMDFSLKPGRNGSVDVLALSGGGINGAYGAGYLIGWTARGDRPQFQLVTGISIGALIAPMAFLGPAYDGRMKQVFSDLATQRSPGLDFIAAIFGAPSITSNRPVVAAIARLVDEQALADIAAEHARGRRLLIGTTNLDAERPVIWDIGAIAASNLPNRLTLVRQIMLASASIPGIFPPVLIKVSAGGANYDELHVDGGVTQQVVLPPGGFLPGTSGRNAHLYVIYNGSIDPSRTPVQVTSASILGRSTLTLLKYRGRGDIALLANSIKSTGADFRLAAMPGDYPDTDSIFGTPAWLLQLYKYGYDSGVAAAWRPEN